MTGDNGRIATLDITRGVAVMGIFSVNVVGMAMIKMAYFYPPITGFDGLEDKLMWLLNFLFVDGKMRSLFSILFGASTLLVIERAVAAGRSPAKTHYARMVVLLLFGLAHFAILWWGDILTHYAAVGMLAFLFWKLRARTLLIISCLGFLLYAGPSAYFAAEGTALYDSVATGDATPQMRKRHAGMDKRLHPDAATLAADRAEHASISAHVRSTLDEGPKALVEPFDLGPLWIETLSLMLLGMAAYKSGFLTGQWSDAHYRGIAIGGLGLGFVAYAGFAAFTWRADFRAPEHMAAYGGYSTLFRPIMALGYAAAIILATRSGGWLSERLAAVGRTAFTNYLGCTIIGTIVFFGSGGGLYGEVSRAQAWLLVPLVWLVMLAWSKPWLDRFHYGPFEWLWRSLARLKLQPMLKRGDAAPALAS